MKEIEKTINGRTFKLREISYKDFAAAKNTSQEDVNKNILKLSANLTDEEYDSLSLAEGINLVQAALELNGLVESTNFQQSNANNQR